MPSQDPPKSLDEVRLLLESFEDSLCDAFAERSKHPFNSAAYWHRSTKTRTHAPFGAYLHMKEYHLNGNPHERRFSTHKINPTQININDAIFEKYMGLLEQICEQGINKNSREVFKKDIAALEMLSRRIHLGEYVAAIKYAGDSEKYDVLIHANDTEGIIEKLRNRQVEKDIANRYREKAAMRGLSGETIANFFTNAILPLTIDVEVAYFMQQRNEALVSEFQSSE